MTRLIDILLSAAALIILSPLLTLIVIALKFTGEGEIFFIQQRVGRGGETFGLYKFATMLKDSPNIGTGTVTLKNDPRVLPLGGFLRSTKINELPQLANVLFGTMSVIGPRPQTRRCFDVFPASSKQSIVTVRPGLSGVGSIVFRGEEHLLDKNDNPEAFYDAVIMPYKGKLEEWYCLNQSVALYLKCILLTVFVVATGKTGIIWRVLPGLPPPPKQLADSGGWDVPTCASGEGS